MTIGSYDNKLKGESKKEILNDKNKPRVGNAKDDNPLQAQYQYHYRYLDNNVNEMNQDSKDKERRVNVLEKVSQELVFYPSKEIEEEIFET